MKFSLESIIYNTFYLGRLKNDETKIDQDT